MLKVGLFDESFKYSEDFDLWLRLAKHGLGMAYQRQVLLCRRVHQASLGSDQVALFEHAVKVLKKTERTLPLTPEEQTALDSYVEKLTAGMNMERGRMQFLRGDYAGAIAAIGDANRFYRSRKLRIMLFGLARAPRLLRRLYNLRTQLDATRRRMLPRRILLAKSANSGLAAVPGGGSQC